MSDPPQTTPILKLPDELLIQIINEVKAMDSKGVACGLIRQSNLVSFSTTHRKIREVCMEHVFSTVYLLRKGDFVPRGVRQRYSEKAQHDPHIASVHVCRVFLWVPLQLFHFTESLALHQFWKDHNSTESNLATTNNMIVEGLWTMIQAPKALRRLHLDLDFCVAELMKQRTPPVMLSHLKELVISIEARFLLELAPKVESVSNLTLWGRRENSPYDYLYRPSLLEDLFERCASKSKLDTIDVTLHGFAIPLHAYPVATPAKTLRISNCVAPSCRETPGFYEDLIQTGTMLHIIRSQPNLTEVQIPVPEEMVMGSTGDDPWEWEGELSDLLPAGIIAAKSKDIVRIKVGDTVLVEVQRAESEDTILKMTRSKESADEARPRRITGDRGPARKSVICPHHRWDMWKEPIAFQTTNFDAPGFQSTELPLRVVCVGEFERPAWIEKGLQGTPTAVVVNIDNIAIEGTDSWSGVDVE